MQATVELNFEETCMNQYQTSHPEKQRQKIRRESDRMTKEELERLGRIEQALSRLESKLANHLESEDELMPKLDILLETFIEAKGVIRFLKIISAVSATFAGAFLFIREVLIWWK